MIRKSYMILALMLVFSGLSYAQDTPAPALVDPSLSGPASDVRPTTVAETIDRIIAREKEVLLDIAASHPIIETYIQDMAPSKDLGTVPVSDHYFLGQANFEHGIVDSNMLLKSKSQVGKVQSRLSKLNPLSGGDWGLQFKATFVPAGFLQMVYVDKTGFDLKHYQFQYVRTEFLGDVKCYVFDVIPLPKSGKGRFFGRIWAENGDFTIVRFNGIYTPVSNATHMNLHFDSWRTNVQPGFWMPAYVFSQESDLKATSGEHIRFKAQTRFWAYNAGKASHDAEMGNMVIDNVEVKDETPVDLSPAQEEREWQREAENNVLDRLEKVGLVAPVGPVDKIMETVINNLEVTNNLDVQPDVRCRVLLTSTLESFSIGHTVVVSRGLLDVLPDEASLATVLAQTLADLMVMKPNTDRWGFNDTTIVDTVDALRQLSFKDEKIDQDASTKQALVLLKKSPYADKLANTGLFMTQLQAQSKALKSLINPHLGNHVFTYADLTGTAPKLERLKIDQIAALPVGSRIKLDGWTNQVSLLNISKSSLDSAREKFPFEITPFIPHLTHFPVAPEAAKEAALAN